MRVFVTGTGRCGTTTFSMACKHFSNYTSAHETTNGRINELEFPENHIESEPTLVWRLPQLIKKYPNDLYVHLWRDKKSCVDSLSKRSSLSFYLKFTERMYSNNYDSKKVANNYYDFATNTVDLYLNNNRLNTIKMKLVPSFEEWKIFCGILNISEVEINKSYAEWQIDYNK